MRKPVAVIAAAIPLHVALALGTDLSPDEAYYLSAARLGSGWLVDHPPLVAWMLAATDGVGSVELGVRIWAIAAAAIVAAAIVEIARNRGVDVVGRVWVAFVASWSLLSTTAGFITTPDTALLGSVACLAWLAGRPAGTERWRERACDVGWVIACGVAPLAKVVAFPIVAAFALFAPGPAWRRAAGMLVALTTLPWVWPSLRFQWSHAYGSATSWTAPAALAAFAEAAVVQLALWTPWVVIGGALGLTRAAAPLTRRGDAAARADLAVVAGLTGLVLASAAVRAIPPEANWWAPAALLLLPWGAGPVAGRSAAHRIGLAAMVLVPTMIAASHALRPWLPLPIARDPTARLHGGATGELPADAPGMGPYAPAAEACAYRGECADIGAYFIEIKQLK